ncbi:MAG TPA: hypothetical protein H9687_05205 [Firmicutes bacterium]|nr:hypothetical protein [Bacillota bacterium]
MKTQEWVMIGVVVLVMLFVFFGHGRQPFQALKEEDLARATVRLTPPDVKMEVENREKLAELLRQVNIGQKDPSWQEYTGQMVQFTLYYTDGSMQTAAVFSPFFLLDGQGYRANRQACEALQQFANDLRDSSEPVVSPLASIYFSEKICRDKTKEHETKESGKETFLRPEARLGNGAGGLWPSTFL